MSRKPPTHPYPSVSQDGVLNFVTVHDCAQRTMYDKIST